MNSPAARLKATSPAEPHPSPRRDHKHAGTQHHDRPVRGSLIAPLSRRAINGRNLASGHANVWGLMSLDEARDLLYVPTSTPSGDYWGGRRPGADLLRSAAALAGDASVVVEEV